MSIFRSKPKGMSLCSPDEVRWIQALSSCLHPALRDVVHHDMQSLDKVIRAKREVYFLIRGGTQSRKDFFADRLGSVMISGAKVDAFPCSCIEFSIVATDCYALSFRNELAAMAPTTPTECRAYLKIPELVVNANVTFQGFATSEYFSCASGVRLGPEFQDEFNWRTSGRLSELASILAQHEFVCSELFGFYGLSPYCFVMPIFDRAYLVIADVGDLLRYVFLDVLNLDEGLQLRHYDEEETKVFGNNLDGAMTALFAEHN